MGKKRLLYYENGVAHYHEYDHDEKKTHILTRDYTVQPLLEANKRHRNDGTGDQKDGMSLLASIPGTLYEQWWREFGGNPMNPENKPRLLKRLREYEFSKLRATDKRF